MKRFVRINDSGHVEIITQSDTPAGATEMTEDTFKRISSIETREELSDALAELGVVWQ